MAGKSPKKKIGNITNATDLLKYFLLGSYAKMEDSLEAASDIILQVFLSVVPSNTESMQVSRIPVLPIAHLSVFGVHTP